MPLLRIAEIFGHPVDDTSPLAVRDRETRRCPFLSSRCIKGNKNDPLGICSLTDGSSLATVCPVRFKQDDRIITDVGRLAFGRGKKVIGAPEVHLLRVPSPDASKEKRVGKVDFLVAELDKQGHPTDFAALEVQSVYISGKSIKPAFKRFIKRGVLGKDGACRPDWRSSTQKRLMPQLLLKMPVFRRWGKKFFVAVDGLFFNNIPKFQETDSLENSEITWLIYPFMRANNGFQIGDPRIIGSTWDDVQSSLREGRPPTQAEIFQEVERKKQDYNLRVLTT